MGEQQRDLSTWVGGWGPGQGQAPMLLLADAFPDLLLARSPQSLAPCAHPCVQVHFHHSQRPGYKIVVSNKEYPVDLLNYK